MSEDIYIRTMVVTIVMCILVSIAILVGAVDQTDTEPQVGDEPVAAMDGSTAGANAVTMEEALAQAE